MTNVLKEFIETNITLIDDNNWRQMLWQALDSVDKAMIRIYARRNCKVDIKEYGCDR